MPSVETTNNIKIEVATVFLDDYSSAKNNHYLFCYRIRMRNTGEETVRLKSRYWKIIDGEGNEEEVQGDGVVGKYPALGPDNPEYEYFSFCPLPTAFGTMEGHYTFKDESGQSFYAAIPRFYMSTNLNEFPKNKYRRGQIVRHKLYRYHGVIVDYHVCFQGDDDWYESNATQPPRNKPWYQVLVSHSDKVSYVSEVNIKPETSEPDGIKHPLLDFFFSGPRDEQSFIRNDNTWNDLYKRKT